MAKLVIAALLGAIFAFLLSGPVTGMWRAIVVGTPEIAYPAKLGLGEQELGDQVTVPFTITNRGRALLVIENIRSNCACTGMEVQTAGRYSRIDSLRVKPGDHADVAMRVTVSGVRTGQEMVNVVQFDTNDPSQPRCRIEAVVTRVTGGVVTEPQSVVFGAVPIGAKVNEVINLRDPASIPRKIVRIASSADRISARLLGAEDQIPEFGDEQNGALVGRLQVSVNTDTPGEVNGTIHLYVEGRPDKPDALTVLGKVVRAFEITPNSVVLPRATNAGPAYIARCVCRCATGESFTLTLDAVPKGFIAQVLGNDDSGHRVLQIEWDPRQPKEAGLANHTIRLRAKSPNNEAILELSVMVRG